jgi:hypothetical protein
MGPRVWLPPIVAALLASLLTAWLVRPAPTPPSRDDEMRDHAAYLERRIAALERTVEELSGRPLPATPAATAQTTSPRREPTLEAGKPRESKPEIESTEPQPAPLLLNAIHSHQQMQASIDMAALQALKDLVSRDPYAAASDVQRLLRSREPKERATAIEFLAGEHGATFLPEVRQALGDAVRDGRRSDVGRLLHTIARTKGRAWSAKQLVGEPDTPIDGDLGTAWASKGEDMGEVWIELDYDRAVRADAIRVVETHNPGAVVKVLGKAPDGTWDVLWEGTERPGAAPWVSEIPLGGRRYATSTIRIVLDTNRVAGWNEIDAVELVGDGLRQWAKDARASSSFAD